jgi:solute carrier family 50 protein (sugar transporter)
MVMGLWYVLSSYGLATHDVRKKIELVTIGLVASLVATITFGGIVYGGNEVATMGIFANVIVFVVFSSPLSTLAMVVREKNSASINRPFGIVQVLNCLTWTFYSLFIADWYLFVPNLVGLVLGLVQCALMLIFPAKKCIKIDELSEPVPRSVESLLQESSESLP